MKTISNTKVEIPISMGNFSVKNTVKSQLQKILVLFYDEESIDALNYASMLASVSNAEIIVLHLTDTEEDPSKDELRKEVKKKVTIKLNPRLSDLQKMYPNVRRIKLQHLGINKTFHEQVVNYIEKNKIDYVVMRNHRLQRKNDFENTASFKVVMACPCPVFTFTMIPQRLLINDILMPLDLSDGSLRKIPFAIKLAKEHGAKIHLLSAIEHKEDRQELIKQMEHVYDIVLNSGVKHVKQIMFDKLLIDSIDEYVKNYQIDLLIVMSKPSFKWSDLWISPKAKRVIAHSEIPVLSIKPTVSPIMPSHIE